MAKSKRIVRSLEERIVDQKKKLAEMERKVRFKAMASAVARGDVKAQDVSRYRKTLRHVKALQKAVVALELRDYDVSEIEDLIRKMIEELASMLKPSKKQT